MQRVESIVIGCGLPDLTDLAHNQDQKQLASNEGCAITPCRHIISTPNDRLSLHVQTA